MNRIIKYCILIAAILLFAFKGIYFKKLNEQKANTALNSADFSNKFWKEKIEPAMDSAVDIVAFVNELKVNAQQTISKYSKTKGITNTAYILVKGKGSITNITADAITIDENKTLNTGIYFGNGVRDVTGLIAMGDFNNTIDFNNVSNELNKLVKTKVIEPLKLKAAKGQTLNFVGILELNKENINVNKIELLPIKIFTVNQ